MFPLGLYNHNFKGQVSILIVSIMPLFYQNITGVVLNLITFVIILLPLPWMGR
ncbi:hypothetical protein C789_50 [Microcystis aeruginosa FACHB-905 = DIANCHI905]|uniref:Uncharacterized protein n=1 Tax=Microcystis aeruginosa PCC 7806SL TaxID=1903187 RepID=A0AB33BRW4_MICA7|nr:hypothetical protein BH695_0874 [Microcystis aeruginosa PCC 7806SL]ELS50125.1 hypothetical protein C789_50 [Microcystis aeruginosa FACHB-905 = DIANCHI905]